MSMPMQHTELPSQPLPSSREGEELSEGQYASWHHANGINGSRDTNAFVKPGSNLLRGQQINKAYTGPDRDFDLNWTNNAERASVPDLQALQEYNKLQGEKQMGQRALERSSHAYDKQLLSRIGGPHNSPRAGGGLPTGPGNEESLSGPQSNFEKLNGQVKPLTMPDRRRSSVEARWISGVQPSSAISPGVSGLRSPVSEHGIEQMLPQRFGNLSTPITMEDPGRSHRDCYDQAMFDYPAQRGGMQDFKNHDRSPSIAEDYQQNSRTGQKRRAVSQLSESVLDPRLPGSDTWAPQSAQEIAAQNSQLARFQTSQSQTPHPSSVLQLMHNGSYAPSYEGTLSNYTSEQMPPLPYDNHDASMANPRGLPTHHHVGLRPGHVSTARLPPHRTTSSGIQRAPGLWICDCCPKKPKKFENEDDLRIHEMEKQYICQYCHNRFKNKNEAERHQNSLHLRRHSWSCSALTSFELAYHPTPPTPVTASLPQQQQGQPPQQNPIPPADPSPYNATQQPQAHPYHNQQPSSPPQPAHLTTAAPTDTCSYCGLEFPKPPDWDVRVDHLNRIHKFGECNQSKKFYRADHFRQHLKHSHAGTSGKWTNMLENACMKDEPPPVPMAMQPGMVGSVVGGGVLMVGNGTGGPVGMAPVASMVPEMQKGE